MRQYQQTCRDSVKIRLFRNFSTTGFCTQRWFTNNHLVQTALNSLKCCISLSQTLAVNR